MQTVQQGSRLEGLSQKTNRSAGGYSGFQVRVGTSSDHDDGHLGIEICEHPFELKAAHAGHVKIGDDAVKSSSRVSRYKLLRRGETSRLVAQ